MHLEYIRIPFENLKKYNLSTNETLVYGIIFTLATTRPFMITNGLLAQELNISEKTVSNAITRLFNLKIIDIEYRHVGNSHLKSRFITPRIFYDLEYVSKRKEDKARNYNEESASIPTAIFREL